MRRNPLANALADRERALRRRYRAGRARTRRRRSGATTSVSRALLPDDGGRLHQRAAAEQVPVRVVDAS